MWQACWRCVSNGALHQCHVVRVPVCAVLCVVCRAVFVWVFQFSSFRKAHQFMLIVILLNFSLRKATTTTRVTIITTAKATEITNYCERKWTEEEATTTTTTITTTATATTTATTASTQKERLIKNIFIYFSLFSRCLCLLLRLTIGSCCLFSVCHLPPLPLHSSMDDSPTLFSIVH